MARKKGEGSIFKYRDRWHAQIQYQDLDGKTCVKRFSSASKKVVSDKLNFYIKNVVNPIKSIKENYYIGGGSGSKTFYEFAVEVAMPIHKMQIKSSSYARLISTLKTMVYPQIGNFPLLSLTPQVLQEYLVNYFMREGYYKDGKKGATKKMYSYSTLKRVYSAVSIVLSYAVRYEYIPTNPMSSVKLPSETKRNEQFGESKIRVMSEEEVKLFTKEALKKKIDGSYLHQYGLAFMICLNTGCRIGELCALKVSDYDKENHRIYVHANVSEFYDPVEGKRIFKLNNSPKTSSGVRYIPLNKEAEEYIKEQIKRYRLRENHFLICTGKRTMNAPSNLRRRFDDIVRAAGLPKSITPHALRHTFASSCFKNKLRPEIISKILGHSSVSITMELYVHISDDLVQREFHEMPAIRGF